jgi:GT2 family glycosyltransferase
MAEHNARPDDTTVAAVVLTYNSHTALQRCVDALARQTRVPDRLLVVDNASAEPVGDLSDRFPGAEVHRTAENLGPAGGYAVALRLFHESAPEGSWAWVLDDDCVPDPSALEHLLATGSSESASTLVFGMVTDSDGHDPIVGVGWWGVLIPRSAVSRVGVPMAELFWWAEDTEYLQWRLPRAGFEPRVARGAVIRVDRLRASRAKPAWKYYYEARNSVYYRLRIQRRTTPPNVATLRNLVIRTWRTARSLAKLFSRILFVEHDERATKSFMFARGVFDGLRGRLGASVSVSTPDRPLVSPGQLGKAK